MTQIDTVSFSCPACSKRLRARVDQGGRTFACPGCGGAVPVPRIAVESNGAPPSLGLSPTSTVAAASAGLHLPASVGQLSIVLFILWSAVAFVSLIISFFGSVAIYVGLAMFFLASIVALQQAWQLLRAPQRVLTVKEVPLFWGTVRLIAWEPTEGVLILRNKAITFRDDDLHDGKGGVRFIYPFLGEEVALRVPLETQTLHFASDNVLTREYLTLSIRGTMKWRITDIGKFYLLVSRELRSGASVADAQGTINSRDVASITARLVDAAIGWLRVLAEEQTRQVVSRVKSGLLIADRLVAEVPEARAAVFAQANGSAEEFGGATDGLAGAIHDTIAERLTEYGIAVAEVSLQEIRMPEEIVRQCIEAARTAYLPLMARHQASTRHAQLHADASVIGKEAVAARELISVAPAYALRDFLTEVIAKNAPAIGGPSVVTQPAAPLATIDITKLHAIQDNPPPSSSSVSVS